MAKKGIDISAHQGDIDLETLKSQIDFVIIRAGYGTKGTIDTKFKRNADLCKQLNIPVGFYWYSYALDVDGAEAEAKAFIEAITPYKDITKFGAWFDMEDADSYKKKNGMPSNQTLRQMCATFCKYVEDNGFYAGIYASENWFKNQLNGDEIAPYDKWIAQWPTSGGKQTGLSTSESKRSDTHLWQFTSQGNFSGYNGNLDTNYAYLEVFPNPETVSKVEESVVVKKSNEQIAEEVIAGKWGNGTERKKLLENAGYDYNAIQNIVNKELTTTKPIASTITKGSKIKFTGTKSYSGITLANWTKNSTFDVIEVSGDRVVIGRGTAVTAAVNVKDCQKI